MSCEVGKIFGDAPLVSHNRGILVYSSISGRFTQSATNLMQALLYSYIDNYKFGRRDLNWFLTSSLDSTCNFLRKEMKSHSKFQARTILYF